MLLARRQFVASIICLGVPAGFAYASFNPIPVIKLAQRHDAAITALEEFVAYGQELLDAAERGSSKPSSPKSLQRIDKQVSRLKMMAAEVMHVSVKAGEQKIPSMPTSVALGKNAGARRAEIAKGARWGAMALKRRSELRGLDEALSRHISRIQAVGTSLDALSKRTWKMHPASTIWSIWNSLGFAGHAIDYELIPALGELDSAVKIKQKEVRQFASDEVAATETPLATLRLILQGELGLLQKELNETYAKSAGFEDRRLKMKQWESSQEGERRRLRAEYELLRPIEVQLKQSRTNYAARSAEVKQQEEFIRQEAYALKTRVYNLCPNKHTFDRCTHTDLKTAWLEEERSRTRRLEEVRRQLLPNIAAARALEREVAEMAAEFKEKSKPYYDALAKFKQDSAALIQARKALTAETKQMKALSTRLEKLIAQNESDSVAVTAK